MLKIIKTIITLLVVFLAVPHTTDSVYATDFNVVFYNTTDSSTTVYNTVTQPNKATQRGFAQFQGVPNSVISGDLIVNGVCDAYDMTINVFELNSSYNPNTLNGQTPPPTAGTQIASFQRPGPQQQSIPITGNFYNGVEFTVTGGTGYYCQFEMNNYLSLNNVAISTPTPTPVPPTPTPTPGGSTPTPTPEWFDLPVTLADGQFLWADALYDYNASLWTSPGNMLGYPDRIYASISGVGFPNTYLEYPRIFPFSYDHGALKAIRIVVVGNNYGNIVIRPAINHTPVCTAQTIAGNGYSYYTFNRTTCPQLTESALYTRGGQGSSISYYIGSNANGGNIDAIGIMPIFDYSPSWVATASATGDTQGNLPPLEVCARTDLMCQIRNWFSSTVTSWFKVDTSFAVAQYNALKDSAYNRAPWAYISAIANVVYTIPNYPTPGVVPDFTIGALNIPTYSGPSNSVTTMHQYLPAATVSGSQYAQYYNAIIAIRTGVLGIITFAFLFAVYGIVKLL